MILETFFINGGKVMSEYKKLSKEQLIKKIHELESLISALKEEKDQTELLKFPWIGNLGHWHFNVQTNNVVCNTKKITTLNYSTEEVPDVMGHEFFTEKLHLDDYDRVMDNMRQHLLGNTEAYEVEYRIKTKDDKWKWFYDRGKVIKFDEYGKPLVVAGIVFDVTEQKEIENVLKEQNKKLLEVVNTDYLTKVFNTRALYEKLETQISSAKRDNEPLCVLILDIDRFKLVNDTYGHLVGDQVIAKVAEIIKTTIRKIDIVGRYGGEEFLVILPNCNVEQGLDISERIRKNIEEAVFSSGAKITISGGLKQFKDEGLDMLIDLADKCLYDAKRTGRNKIVPYKKL
ncbi:MAG: pleD [Bacillales bacterium]|jgi:diguanylate cyclase (GGDEF)-like protein/PAS domain S-box-containing protein|nr:pleD [Bacillales bacterium]